jgi:hypothetical protein
MVTMKFGFDEALPILLPCEIHSFFLTHPIQNLIQYSPGTVNAIHDEVIGDHPCRLCFNTSTECDYMAVNKYSICRF